ncbi:MAG: hypothetical protein Q4D21_07400 [Phascolarctobacterium sp.]|nr:hypothetical protein [Phascolarctobacterium sp.]
MVCCIDPFYPEKEKRFREKMQAESDRRVANWLKQILANETTFEEIRTSGQATLPELEKIKAYLESQ